MNNIIKSQLDSLGMKLEEGSTRLIINKRNIKEKKFEKGHAYKIELADYIINPSSSSTLASNWNAGNIPTSKIYMADVIDVLNDMIKINGVSPYDLSNSFYGWLPKDGVLILEEL